MAKLFAPLIESNIPAFYADETDNTNGILNINIPFTMNNAVSSNEIKGITVKAKNVQSSSYIGEDEVIFTNGTVLSKDNYFTWKINKKNNNSVYSKFKSGMYYKFQIAYLNQSNEVGYYSTVGIGKCTKKPEVVIQGLDKEKDNNNLQHYIGFYKNNDVTEKLYSYEYVLEDENQNVLKSSGKKIYSIVNEDTLGEASTEFDLNYELQDGKNYYLIYKIKTINGLEVESPRYKIVYLGSVQASEDLDIIPTSDYENGFIDIKLKWNKEADKNKLIFGYFILSRADKDESYTIWHKITDFKLMQQDPTRITWRDFTVEQGKTYKYSLQQYNEKLDIYSERIISNPIIADYEDMFLFDGKRQLKIKFNPKVTSFKTTYLESKTDTIGNKYPFIFRNGIVEYKEFPISGLISYFMDDQEFFYKLKFDEEETRIRDSMLYKDMTKDQIKEEQANEKKFNYKTTNLVSNNIKNERLFKLEVLDWLNDGQPKLFKSPNEGNYTVRLMNVSMTPIDQLGRMLHSFSATAYEIGETDYESMKNFNFIGVANTNKNNSEDEINITTDIELRDEVDIWRSIFSGDLNTTKPKTGYDHYETFSTPGYLLNINDFLPGTEIGIKFDPSSSAKFETFIIGTTGSFILDPTIKFYGIYYKLPKNREYDDYDKYGQITFVQKMKEMLDQFSLIDRFEIKDVPDYQIFGYSNKNENLDQNENRCDIMKALSFYFAYDNNWVKSPIYELGKIYQINFLKLPCYTDSSLSKYEFENDSLERIDYSISFVYDNGQTIEFNIQEKEKLALKDIDVKGLIHIYIGKQIEAHLTFQQKTIHYIGENTILQGQTNKNKALYEWLQAKEKEGIKVS